MALCPFAKHLLIKPGSNDPRITPRVAILHVDAGNAESLFAFFRDRSGGIESHFHVRKDGVIEQYRDTGFQADANNDANDFAVSIETQGFGAGEWTSAQLTSIRRLLVWLNDVHDIPLRKIERWDGSGVGYHTLFGAPSHWTPVAKSCPGPDRIKQFDAVLVPWMRGASNPKPRKRRAALRVGVINIPTKVGEAAWRKCWAETAERCGIFGVNEAFHPKAKALYLELAKEHGYGQYGTRATPNPVFFDRRRWRHVEGRVHRIHGRGERFARWPGFNESRYVTDEVLARRGRPDSPEAAVLNTHWVPNGRKVTRVFRAAARRQSKRLVAQLVREHQAAGRIVYLIGDTNIAEEFALAVPGFQWIRGKGIDKVGVAVPRGYVVGKTSVDVFDAPTDHKHGVATTAQIKKGTGR